jgi:hypothetical protein
MGDGQTRLLSDPGAAFHFDGAGLRQIPEVELELGNLAVLAGDGDAGAVSQAFGGDLEGEFRAAGIGGGFADNNGRRHQALPRGAHPQGQGALQSSGG